MQEITIDQAREKTSTWKKEGKAWHFHVLFPDCIFNTQNKKYAMVLEDRTSGETFVVYSVDGFAKISQEFLKLIYGDDILKTRAGADSKDKPSSKLLAQAKIFKQNEVVWHHHMLFPDCIFNDHPGKWNIVMEGSGEKRTYSGVYDEEPVDEFQQIEIEYFKQIDPTFKG